ncbi:hypothetical protein [Corynebacterium auriscanis]|uniref:hypothetical protein n=1 Tax=Corynebacterium auriscanis TaxID=99807 RepID=UPI002245DADE|nr:hypothetical protein [Corynebacterium auriscanis]MCX2164058.1 hypothetical protein [Corynebacterium auriscanis]
MFALEEVEGDRVGVVGLDEFEAFGFELVALGGQELAFVLAGPAVCRILPACERWISVAF